MSSKSFFSNVVKVDKQRMSDEGDDSPPRPKRKIKRVVIISSSSESESDENVGVAAGSRRKKLRIISDEEDNGSSSGSSIICAGARRRRTLPKLKDSDADSDSSGWATDRSDGPKPAASTSKTTSGFTSDSSEGNSDKCSICLLRFTNQKVGTPEDCEHIFCLDCIVEWSKNVNTCPVDRMVFNSIVVRACAGGRVLHTQPVKVIERRPSLDLFVSEDPTVCEICGSTEGEETMLLCDGCDLGYHMLCLTPPLTEVPPDQWLCPNCYTDILDDDDVLQNINFSEVGDLLDDILDTEPSGPRPSALRQQRIVRRSSRNVNVSNQPSTSTGRSGNSANRTVPSTTSLGSRSTRRNTSHSTTRSRATKRRKYKRRRAKTVIIEYEVQENGKFPVTRKVTKRVKKRRVKKRQPRTAARRTHVRASVRARLAALHAPRAAPGADPGAPVEPELRALALQRQRAGIQRLRLFGNPHELEYFSDENNAISEEASTAVAFRATANVFSAYRQARRKMISVPSPPHASSAPDILSDILESQTLLHSKNSIMSISVDGNVNIKLQAERLKKNTKDSKKEDKIDLSKANAAAKSVPSYPGQNRGGGWGGGYRGSYHRDQANSFRGGNPEGAYGGGYQSRQGNSYNYQNNNNNMRRDDTDYYDTFPRRPQQYSHNDDTFFDRSRRPVPENNRGSIFSQHHRTSDQGQGRYGPGPPWQPYSSAGSIPRQDVPPAQARHSFGGFETPVDMRMGQMPPITTNVDTFLSVETQRQEKIQPQVYQSLPEPHAYQPLSEPPVFNFPKISEVEKSEDEKSDSGLVIDTEKYDPTEPTNDDDSGDDETPVGTLVVTQAAGPVVVPVPSGPAPLSPPPVLQSILAGIDTSAMNVPPNILDTAVRQVLKEHRNLIVSPSIESHNDRSDDDSDGDCPNFSIYSAASVHIANNSNTLTMEVEPKEQTEDSLEDLVQEDDETPPPTSPVVQDIEIKFSGDKIQNKSHYSTSEYDEKKKSEEEYKEKVSKRCPITTNKRNPIKIKLNTPSLIKRQVSLYDEEETSQDVDTDEKFGNLESPRDRNEERPVADDNITKVNITENNESSIKNTNTARNREENIVIPEEATFNEKNSDDLESKQMSDHETEESVHPMRNKLKNSFQNGEEKLPFKEETENNTKVLVNNTNTDDVIHEDDKASCDSDQELCFDQQSPKTDLDREKINENIEKMTESVSETEDERSYTPCLDENKSTKDAPLETEKEKGIEGLDTEMISEDEGNEMFSENERPPSETFFPSPVVAPAGGEEAVVPEKKKESKKSNDSGKKKKKKDSKKEGKERSKNKKKSEISFKKLSKSGKERNYRERDKDDKKSERERRDSGDENRQRRRKEKRKDLERYDVRTVVTEKRRKQKDPFGRDVSPRGRSPSPSPPPASPARRSPSPARRSPSRTGRSPSRNRRSPSRNRSLSRNRRSPSRTRISPARMRRSVSRVRRSLSGYRRSPSRVRRSPSRNRRSVSRGRRSASRGRRSPSVPRHSPARARRSPFARKSSMRRTSPVRDPSPSPPHPRRSPGRARRSVSSARRRSGTPQTSPRRRSPPRRKRRRSASRVSRPARSPPRRAPKKKKRARSGRRAPAASPGRKKRRSASRPTEPVPPSPASRPPSPRTPPPEPEPEPERRERRRRDPERPRRRGRDPIGPSKEVFTSGDNILVSVSFKEQERSEDGEKRRRRESRRERRRRRRAAAAPDETVKPVAIIDLERSPFRELTPSPKNVIVLSDSEPGERDAAESAPAPAAPEPAPEPAAAAGPKTPPSPSPAAAEREASPAERAAASGPAGAPSPSPDAYDPFEPTRSPSASPARAPSPPRAHLTLEAAQRSNLSADEVLARRPLTPVEKVMALLQSTREAEEAEAEAPAAPRIVLPSPTRAPPKLFPGKPSPIKSNPVKPMQAARLPRAPSDGGASPYSPGSSDFGELFEPPPRRARAAARVPVRLDRKRGKTQVGVKLDEDNLKILDELPSSAVELQVKSKFLKKLNRQERVVEEVKLVLKPHYNKKRVTKEEYKDILRRAVPKICHNKSGEINPTKIQALVEAYVKKFRKKHKLGVA